MKATKLFDRHARNICHGPGGKFAVSVFTQHVSMNVMHIHSAVPAQQVAEASAVQHGARPYHPSARPAGSLVGDVSQDIHRITNHQKNRRRILKHNPIYDALDNFGVSLEQLQTRFPGPLFGSGRYHNHVSIRIIRVSPFVDLDGREKGLTVGQVKNLSECQFMIGVEQGDLVSQTTLSQRVGEGGTHRASPNNYDLPWSPTVIIHSCSLVSVQTCLLYT